MTPHEAQSFHAGRADERLHRPRARGAPRTEATIALERRALRRKAEIAAS